MKKYEVLEVSGPDFVIRAYDTKTDLIMALLPSVGQFYIKDQKTDKLEKISVDGIKLFLSDIPATGLLITDSSGNVPFWCERLYKHKVFVAVLYNTITKPEMQEFLKKGFCYVDCISEDKLVHSVSDVIPRTSSYINAFNRIPVEIAAEYQDLILRMFPKIFKGTNIDQRAIAKYISTASTCMYPYCDDLQENDDIVNVFNFLFGNNFCWRALAETNYLSIKERWGIEGIRLIVQKIIENHRYINPVIDLDRVFYRNRLNNQAKTETKFELSAFVKYLFDESFKQGYACRLAEFCCSWGDFLNMQLTMYGKICEKYSPALASEETALSYKYSAWIKFRKEDIFKETSESLVKYEYKNDKYMIVVPKCSSDMLDEAQQQSNCLASYVDRFAEGKTMIFFCRLVSEPDRSFVTIEVSNKNQLVQVKARFNRDPDQEAYDFIKKWHKKFFSDSDAVEKK